jgi:hypothetical protein
MVKGLLSTVNYNYDIANCLVDVDSVVEYDANCNLIKDLSEFAQEKKSARSLMVCFLALDAARDTGR